MFNNILKALHYERKTTRVINVSCFQSYNNHYFLFSCFLYAYTSAVLGKFRASCLWLKLAVVCVVPSIKVYM